MGFIRQDLKNKQTLKSAAWASEFGTQRSLSNEAKVNNLII